MAIQSFADKATRVLFEDGVVVKGVKWQSIKKVALRKLDMLDFATKLVDLKSPPSNHLEPLKGNLRGLHSIRINDPWRIVFRWTNHGPEFVRIMDYH